MGYAGAAVDAALGIPRPAYAAKRRRGRRGVPSDASGGVELLLRVHARTDLPRDLRIWPQLGACLNGPVFRQFAFPAPSCVLSARTHNPLVPGSNPGGPIEKTAAKAGFPFRAKRRCADGHQASF
jgi:hypothetical protein